MRAAEPLRYGISGEAEHVALCIGVLVMILGAFGSSTGRMYSEMFIDFSIFHINSKVSHLETNLCNPSTSKVFPVARPSL